MDSSIWVDKYEILKRADQARRNKNAQVAAIRRGDMDKVAHDLFPKSWPKSITANIIDIAAQDMGEMLGGLPKVRVRPHGSSVRENQRAVTATKIVNGYISFSGLQRHFFGACDRLVTFGTLPLVVEPDFEENMPVIRVASSTNTFYEKDLRGRVRHFFEWWNEPLNVLEAKFPDADLRRATVHGQTPYGYDHESDELLTVVKYQSKSEMVMFVPERDNVVLKRANNPIGKCLAYVVELPQWDDELHGSFENTLWVQIARARMALQTMEAMDVSIHAPIAVTPDVTKFAVGPGAVIRSQRPSEIRRIGIDVPREAWVQAQSLEREERIAARYPEGRSGNIDASVITGQGVDALLGTIDSKMKTLQTLIAIEMREALSAMLELDEALWPDEKKSTEGYLQGRKYKENYVPARDIRGDYSVEVSYGMMHGLDPNRAAVMQLQYLGAGLVDKGTVRREMPFDVDVDDIEERLDREAIEEAVRAGVQSMAANLGTAAQMGQDPVDLLAKMASLVEAREKGTPLTQAVLEIFQKAQEEQPPADPFAQAEAAMTPGAEAPPTGPPALTDLLAGITSSGSPQMSARTQRRMVV